MGGVEFGGSFFGGFGFCVADIPGIIEGAAEGKGLGVRFLRHIERNSILLFMIAADSHNVVGDYKILLGELERYNPELLDKKRILTIFKIKYISLQLLFLKSKKK